ncbi:hypothetical protein C0991_009874 [Blastosporella zonata]|nr:hypothetical protein C0991_009874 [Blastosporella zonata]
MLRQGLNDYEEDVVQWGANSLYRGGTDTTTAASTTFMLAMETLIACLRTIMEFLYRSFGLGTVRYDFSSVSNAVGIESRTSLVSHPKPFPFSIKPRSADSDALISNIFEDHPPAPTNAKDL